LSSGRYQAVLGRISSYEVLIIRSIDDSVLGTQNVLYPAYSSTLDNRSATYASDVCRLPNKFYEALSFNVSIAGNYTFWSHSDIDTNDNFYRDDFNPFQSAKNQLNVITYRCHNREFYIVYHLYPNTKYILVVSTSRVNTTGSFSVISHGPTSIQLVRVGKCASNCTE
jgi:hypothetical protein